MSQWFLAAACPRSTAQKIDLRRWATDTGQAEFLCQTIRVLQPQLKSQRTLHDLRVRHWKLADREVLKLHLHRQLLCRQNIAGFAKDHRQLACDQSMLRIFSRPRLQKTTLRTAARASTVDEVLFHMTDFGDVKVRWDEAAIRQDKQQGLVSMGIQMREKFGDVHEVRVGLNSIAAVRATGIRVGSQFIQAAQKGAEAGTGEAVIDIQATLFTGQHSSTAHQRQMLGDRGHVSPDKRLEITHAFLTFHQSLGDEHSRGVRQGFDHRDTTRNRFGRNRRCRGLGHLFGDIAK